MRQTGKKGRRKKNERKNEPKFLLPPEQISSLGVLERSDSFFFRKREEGSKFRYIKTILKVETCGNFNIFRRR